MDSDSYLSLSNTEVQKKALFAKVRNGQVRVLIGSTFKMGAGTNCQDRLIALHDLDCPWRPADLQQRLGRIVRQGNKNPEVEIFRYVTESTFDSYLYQLVENKQKFISQIMTSKSPVRSADDVDEAALSYAEIKALATGNPMIIEKSNLEMDVGKLKLLQANHLSQRYELEDKILKEYPREIKCFEKLIVGYKADMERVTAHTPVDKEKFPPMLIHGITYTEKADAGNALIIACKQMTSPDPVPVGFYRGFEMELFFETFAKEYRMNLKGAMRHTVSLGSDIHGNITRLNNVLENFESKLKACKEKLDGVVSQMYTAKIELDMPFPQENELHKKTERLNELNVLLNMAEKDHTLIDGEPDVCVGQLKPDMHMER